MIICGISIASAEATLVWVDADSSHLIGGEKVSLADPYDREDLSRTSGLIRQLLVEKKTEIVVVRKSSTSGKFVAGHIAFRLEAIIAMSVPSELIFVSPQSTAAFEKRVVPTLPGNIRKYQRDAYMTAISVVEQ